MDIYREAILDHYKHPQNAGSLPHPDRQARGANPLCGDAVTMTLALEGDHVRDVKFAGEGCAISIASASMLTEAVKGKTVQDIRAMNVQAVLDLLKVELSQTRLKCGMLPLETLQKAVK